MLQVARQVYAHANASALKPAQWSALRYLSRAAPSAQTNRAFASYHQTTTGTSSVTLKSLVQKGLITRGDDPNDKRAVIFKLTAEGERMLARDPLKLLVDAIDQLPEAQRVPMTDAITEILITMTRE